MGRRPEYTDPKVVAQGEGREGKAGAPDPTPVPTDRWEPGRDWGNPLETDGVGAGRPGCSNRAGVSQSVDQEQVWLEALGICRVCLPWNSPSPSRPVRVRPCHPRFTGDTPGMDAQSSLAIPAPAPLMLHSVPSDPRPLPGLCHSPLQCGDQGHEEAGLRHWACRRAEGRGARPAPGPPSVEVLAPPPPTELAGQPPVHMPDSSAADSGGGGAWHFYEINGCIVTELRPGLHPFPFRTTCLSLPASSTSRGLEYAYRCSS